MPVVPASRRRARGAGRRTGVAGAARQAGSARAGQRLALPGRYMPGTDQRSHTIAGRTSGDPMKHAVVALALAAALPAAEAAHAQEELAKKHTCFACHAVDKKLVGPSYKDVAAKYRDDKQAQPKLFEKVKKGGQGVWGQVPMPPNSQVPDNDIHSLVKWILSQK